MLLQLLFNIWEVDTKCFQKYIPAKKEDKDFGKNKSANTLFVIIFNEKQQFFSHQSQTKKNQNY